MFQLSLIATSQHPLEFALTIVKRVSLKSPLLETTIGLSNLNKGRNARTSESHSTAVKRCVAFLTTW